MVNTNTDCACIGRISLQRKKYTKYRKQGESNGYSGQSVR